MEFRDRNATGRLLDDVVRPRGAFAWLAGGSADGRISKKKLLAQLGWRNAPERLEAAVQSAARRAPPDGKAIATFGEKPRAGRLSVRETLAGRHILLIGVTGFIGQVWLLDLLQNIPYLTRITLPTLRTPPTSPLLPFYKISPAPPPLHD